MKKKFIFSVIVLLVIGSSVLYAQNNTILGTGVYRTIGAETNLVVIKARTGSSVRDITILNPDGKVFMQAVGRWQNGSFEVDFGSDGFDIWTIVSNKEFIDGTGKTWRWIRQNL
jgi:hypothetical protein